MKEQDRLMAEVEKLEGDKEILYVIGYNLGKNEGIKEFAGLLRRYSKPICLSYGDNLYDVFVSTAIINEVERKMTEQVNGKA